MNYYLELLKKVNIYLQFFLYLFEKFSFNNNFKLFLILPEINTKWIFLLRLKINNFISLSQKRHLFVQYTNAWPKIGKKRNLLNLSISCFNTPFPILWEGFTVFILPFESQIIYIFMNFSIFLKNILNY